MQLRVKISAVTVILSLLLLGGLIMVFSLQALEIIDYKTRHSKIGAQQYQLNAILTDLQNAESSQRGFLLTGDEAYLDLYTRSVSYVRPRIEEAKKMFAAEPLVLERILMMQELTAFKLDEMEQSIQLRRSQGPQASLAVMKTGQGKAFMERLHAVIGRLIDEKFAENLQLNERLALRLQNAIYLMAGIGTCVFLGVLFASWQMARALSANAALSARLKREVGHDELTGLPNRRFVIQWLAQALAIADRNKSTVGVLFVDLDGFKQVNDNFGHDAGDAVLCAATERFKKTLRKADLLARFGGDEFAVITMTNQATQDLPTLAQRLIESLGEPLLPYLPPNAVSASIGIAAFPTDGKTADALMNAADAAMYRAKKEGKARFAFAIAVNEPET